MGRFIFFIFMFIFYSCSVKKDIEYIPIENKIIPKEIIKDTIKAKTDTVKIKTDTIKKDAPIKKNQIPTRQYRYMRRIIHRNNPVT